MASHNKHRLFEALPFDIHFEVAKYLDFISALHLASTNRYFHQAINPRTNVPKDEVSNFVLQRDVADVNTTQALFACYKCFRFLPQEKFAKKATTDRKSKRGAAFTNKRERTCFDCAGKHRVYEHLHPISNGKLRYYFCHNCGQHKTKSVQCQGPRQDTDSGIAGVLDMCDVKAPKRRTGLEALPTHILKNITSHLGFHDAIVLATVSHVLRDTIKPLKWVPFHTRYRFVHDKWHGDVLDDAAEAHKTYPCYTCCQIRPKAKFTKIQVNKFHKYPETAWKMRCQSCIQRMYRGQKNLMRLDHKRRYMCEICKCIKIGGKTCGGCLELYVKGGIDRRTMYPVKQMDTADYGDLINEYDGIFLGEE
ncbi:hypothetical protein B0T10DRAFT_479859 [Thelonectria olida]|uniref:F-box domain-containing protein n=1 Tax=Thelonectria olida TaxID=1576542 RepID=A0A9P8WDM9_9HYPO|nr:hypothetical protein B0T10DRAFT_479859 [Thelonectria olida]